MGINLRLKELILRSGEHANAAWMMAAEKRVKYLANRKEQFTSEDVLNYLAKKGYKTHDNSALGSIMLRYSKDGKIKKLGWKQSTRKARHGAPVRIWIGKEV